MVKPAAEAFSVEYALCCLGDDQLDLAKLLASVFPFDQIAEALVDG